jgi:hypothetical protein
MKIYAYGDSYIANGWHPFQVPGLPTLYFDGWTQILAKNLNVELHNRGVSGGSTENAILKFADDVRNSEFNSGDVILFQTSTPGRLHLEFQKERPETASVYLHEVDITQPRHAWYRENQRYIRWYIENFDVNVAQLNHVCYQHTIINFARSRPDLKIVLLSNSHQDEYEHIKLPEPSENCIIVPVELDRVAKNEWIDCTYNEWISFTRFDARINHLSNPNLNTMAQLISESLTTGSTDNFTYDKFQQRIFSPIRSREDYYRYAEQGLIYNKPTFFNIK